ncbi:MAG: NUDIX hydrolase [Chloroflexota bacterium]
MDDQQLVETTIASHLIHTGRYLSVRVDTVLDGDGGQHTRDVVEHPGAVAIVAVQDGHVLMVHQYRLPAGQVLVEIPAGTLERGPDRSTEDPALAAARELGEETGYAAATWRHLGAFYTAPGFAEEYMHLYVATDLTPIDGHRPDEDERLRVEHVPWRDAVRQATDGTLKDAKSLIGLLLLDRLVSAGEVDPG